MKGALQVFLFQLFLFHWRQGCFGFFWFDAFENVPIHNLLATGPGLVKELDSVGTEMPPGRSGLIIGGYIAAGKRS